MSFHIICVDTGEPLEREGTKLIFELGADAAAHSRVVSEETGKRHKVQPIVDTSWRERELGRLRDGTYTELPWHGAGANAFDYPEEWSWGWFIRDRKPEAEHHYAHVSSKVPGNIAFTETDEKGSRDIQTTMKPGRYLSRFYNLPADTVTRYANLFIAQYGALQLKFADTPDAIEHVYLNGPNSCMSHPLCDYQSSVHPTCVYGAGDLAIAYLTAGDGDGPEHISARVVCWPAKKVYGRIYGDEDKLGTLLEAQGYTEDWKALVGARLLNIEADGAYVVPYLDGDLSAEDCGKYLRICKGGDISGESTTGLSEDNRQECQCCSGRFEEDYGSYVDDAGGFVCESCYDDNSFHCDYADETVWGDESVAMTNAQTWSQDAFDRHGFQCDGNGRLYHNDDKVTLETGETWCAEYFADHGFECAGNGGNYSIEVAVPRPNGETWSREYAEEHSDQQCEPEETLVELKHKARQGIDHHPAQLDLIHAIHDAESVDAIASYLYPMGKANYKETA